MPKLNYFERALRPSRHMGKFKLSATGIPAYRSEPIALAGTATETPTELEVLTGSQTLTLTLTAPAKWLPAGETSFDAIRQAVIDGLESRQSEATGWNALLRDAMATSTVARTSDTVMTITLPATPTYRISADEEITIKVPQHAIVGGAGQSDALLLVIPNATTAVTAALTGTFLTTPTEGEVVSGSQTIIITLTGSTWVASGTLFDAQRQAIIDGLVSDGEEATGWNTLVRDEMAVTTVARTNDTTVTITLPATENYAIEAAETVTVTVPKLAVRVVDADIVATPAIVIEPD